MKKAIVIYGPPGSGKGTQAELLARRFDVIHFDTGKRIDAIVHDKESANDPIIKRERENYDAGRLCTPSWVLRLITKTTTDIARAGWGIILSGSPRTAHEAFGDEKKKGFFTLLEKLYKKENILVFFLSISEKTSLERRKSRFICSICGLPALASAKLRVCAFCSGPLRKRRDDSPNILMARVKEYHEKTEPILMGVKKHKYKFYKLDGEKPPFQISEEIRKIINRQ